MVDIVWSDGWLGGVGVCTFVVDGSGWLGYGRVVIMLRIGENVRKFRAQEESREGR